MIRRITSVKNRLHIRYHVKYQSNSSNLSNNITQNLHNVKNEIISRPPSLIRLAVVGSSVTLATPLFTVAGIYRIWSAVLPTTQFGQFIKNTTAVIIGGSALTLFYHYIIPTVMDYADVILPFALSNGVSCVFWMGVGESIVGFEFLVGMATNSTIGAVTSWLPQWITSRAIISSILSLPAGGAVIGGLTALTAPLLWPQMTKLCWEPQFRSILLGGDSMVWLMDLYYQFVIPVGLPVGIFSGIALHSVLKPAVIGRPGVPWFHLTLPILAGLIALCGIVYSPKYTRGGGLDYSDFIWIQRRNHLTGKLQSMNISTLEYQNDTHRSDRSTNLRNLVEMFHTIRDPFKPFRSLYSSQAPTSRSELHIIHFPSLKSKVGLNDSAEISLLENIYGIIDILIYKKYLDSLHASHVTISRLKHHTPAETEGDTGTGGPSSIILKTDLLHELKKIAKENYGIHDLNKLEKEMDTFCLTKLRLSTFNTTSPLTVGKTTTSAEEMKEEKILKLTKERIFESFGMKGYPSSSSPAAVNDDDDDKSEKVIIHNFIENNHLYEEELKEKLGVIFTLGQSDEVTRLYHKDEERKHWLEMIGNVAFYGGMVGIPVMIMTMMMTRN